MNTRPLVSVIDDDESVRESLPSLLARFGLAVRSFSSGDEFLSSDEILHTNCLVLDITMPGMSGIEVFERLKRLGRDIPVIFITAHRDESVRSQVLEQGAIACLFKPFSGKALRSAIEDALKIGR
jgi:FixJ family two-component response regulator